MVGVAQDGDPCAHAAGQRHRALFDERQIQCVAGDQELQQRGAVGAVLATGAAASAGNAAPADTRVIPATPADAGRYR